MRGGQRDPRGLDAGGADGAGRPGRRLFHSDEAAHHGPVVEARHRAGEGGRPVADSALPCGPGEQGPRVVLRD
eukprot:11184429-Lingulodinium_polyedra.AAC.1